jgi:hypothetical protein
MVRNADFGAGIQRWTAGAFWPPSVGSLEQYGNNSEIETTRWTADDARVRKRFAAVAICGKFALEIRSWEQKAASFRIPEGLYSRDAQACP